MTDRMERITSMLKDMPKDPFLRFALAKEWEKKEAWTQALTEYAWLAEYIPEYTGTYYHYGLLLVRQNQLEQARNVFETGMKICLAQGDRHSHGELRTLYDEYFLD
ncbi:MAG: hypothetical protein K9I85_03550 [Saprospiraceae bacterium]|nr:hypothetical protein [Saprospiraceae bacterium]